MRVERRGMMLVLSSPSGAGKTTLARRLLEEDSQVSMSVSATTRAPRPGEVDGTDYIFVDEATFLKMQDASEFLEWACVFSNHYGTPRAPVEKLMAQGRDVLFDIDWQGTQQLAQRAKSDLVRVFILPPSVEALETRLRTRNQDSADVVQQRMEKAFDEISHWAEYDYVIINHDVEDSLQSLQAILHAERLKRARQPGLSEFVRGLRPKN